MSVLSELIVSNNSIREIDDNFCSKAKILRTLDLSNNSLAYTDINLWLKGLDKCEELTTLILSHNKITKFPFSEKTSSGYKSKKRYVYIEHNGIEELNVRIIIIINKSKTLRNTS